jgi:uncharacterized membrane protein
MAYARYYRELDYNLGSTWWCFSSPPPFATATVVTADSHGTVVIVAAALSQALFFFLHRLWHRLTLARHLKAANQASPVSYILW